MLVIKNKHKLKGQTLSYKDVEYYVEGVYEYPNEYDIHLRSFDTTIMDETITLRRHKTDGDFTYPIYNRNNKGMKLNLTYNTIMSKGVFICAIESMLNQ